jgi:hypothetical protein
MAYGWIIDREYVTGDMDLPSREGWVGPRGIPKRIEALLREGGGKAFRMYCDDEQEADTLCYEGRLLADEDDDDVTEFEPLDDLGTPDAGCSTIKYFEDGEWVAL